ncbi:MAG: FecCD family ABC transporter permease [Coriobacteriales bacterium]|jgi:iron complex transport system permease protein
MAETDTNTQEQPALDTEAKAPEADTAVTAPTAKEGTELSESERAARLAAIDATFADKISMRVKTVFGLIFLVIFLFSFFAGTYSLAEGHSLGTMVSAVGEHFAAYFGLFGARLQYAVSAPIYAADGTLNTSIGARIGFFFSNFYDGLTGLDVANYVSDKKLDLALFNIRLPRIVLVLLVGAALSCAGGAFQGMFKNPLVSPDLLGASAGASLGACLAMLFDYPNIIVQLWAFLGGLLAVGITVWMRRMIKSDAILGLVLAGMLVSTLFQSGMSFVKLVADTNDKLPAITYWLMGSFHSASKDDFWLAIIPMLVGFVLMFSQRWKLNVLSFGDEEARSMGVDTKRTRLIVILGATLVTSTSVAVAGIIGWIGLVIPHFARAVVGPNYRVLIPACVVMGSAYLLVIDDLARMLLSVEIPIGILTSILGVPFFLVIFRKTSRGW